MCSMSQEPEFLMGPGVQTHPRNWCLLLAIIAISRLSELPFSCTYLFLFFENSVQAPTKSLY